MGINKKDNPLFLGSSRKLFANARELRKSMTDAEVLLWERLRNNKLMGHKFRRQHPIAGFIADFYCHEAKLIIELDSSIHQLSDHQEYDEGRTIELEESGLKVVRFTNAEVLNNIQEVLDQIIKYIQS
ncbi:MAG: endonuclease domain-containing protein [Bacteroidales bacterium]|nr:endonuclease domain-containing protein [Bacteroidales bacterium]